MRAIVDSYQPGFDLDRPDIQVLVKVFIKQLYALLPSYYSPHALNHPRSRVESDQREMTGLLGFLQVCPQ